MESIVTGSVAETEEFARRLASHLAPGTLILLHGTLGAGKTAFVRGLAAGLGIDPEDVSSPTFTLVQEHRGRSRLQHVDLYRLQPGREVDELALDEFLARGDIVAVEWANRLHDAPPEAIVVRLEDVGENRRRIVVEKVGA